ncbi:hypothetical protein DBV15_04401, partial [Temnothorax longispinosus]
EITNMINTAEPSQDKTLQIPFYSEVTPKAYQYADSAATPTSVQYQPPFVTYMQNPYRSNEELSATNEIVGGIEDFFISFVQLKKKNDTLPPLYQHWITDIFDEYNTKNQIYIPPPRLG